MTPRRWIIAVVLLLVLYQAAVRSHSITQPSPKGVWFWRGVMMSYNHLAWLVGYEVTYYVAGPAWEPTDSGIRAMFDHALLFREYTIAFRTGQIVGFTTSAAFHIGLVYLVMKGLQR